MCSEEGGQMLEPVYAVLDLETTGLDRNEDRIIQVGILKVKNDKITPWMTFLNPLKSRDSQLKAFKVHKISPDILLFKKPFKKVAQELRKFLEDVEYVVCYNCLFDWSILVAEFGRLQEEAELKEGQKLLARIQWVDLYRLAIKTYPNDKSLNTGALFNKFSISTKKAQSYHYHLSCTNSEGEQTQEFILSEMNQKHWDEGHHDAMSDSLATNSLLKKLLQLNGYKNTVELVNDFPQCLIDTELFLAMERLFTEGKTSNEDLMPFATRAGKYYSTAPSLRGKTLSQSPKSKINNSLHFGGEEDDERVRLIYQAALLQIPDESPKRQLTNVVPDPEISPKKTKSE